jgi:hypothetical protein
MKSSWFFRIVWVFSIGFARESVERHFQISNIVACNMLPSSYRLSGPDLSLGIQTESQP